MKNFPEKILIKIADFSSTLNSLVDIWTIAKNTTRNIDCDHINLHIVLWDVLNLYCSGIVILRYTGSYFAYISYNKLLLYILGNKHFKINSEYPSFPKRIWNYWKFPSIYFHNVNVNRKKLFPNGILMNVYNIIKAARWGSCARNP